MTNIDNRITKAESKKIIEILYQLPLGQKSMAEMVGASPFQAASILAGVGDITREQAENLYKNLGPDVGFLLKYCSADFAEKNGYVSNQNETPRYGGSLMQSHDILYKFLPQGQMLGPVVTEIIRKHNSDPRIVLDLGCGAGETTAYAVIAAPNARIHAVDIDRHMLERTRASLVHARNARHELYTILEDMRDYVVDTCSNLYDVVVSGWALHNFSESDRKDLLSGIYSMLTPGGIFVNMDKYVPDSPREERRILARRETRYDALALMNPSAVAEIRAHDTQDAQPPYRQTLRDGLAAMREAGFHDVKMRARCELEAVVSGVKR